MSEESASQSAREDAQKYLTVVPVEPPPAEYRVQRNAAHPPEGTRRNRYALPQGLKSASPVGYRTRLSLSPEECQHALALLSLEAPTGFAPPLPVQEFELFDECALGILVSRQSTNFRGHRQTTVGPDTSAEITSILKEMQGVRTDVLDQSSYSHIIFTRPYRTPFTMLLTLLGHKPWFSFPSVLWRVFRKRFFHVDDIPTIGFLKDLHLGILADGMERAAVIASRGRRRAQVHMAPFCGATAQANKDLISRIEEIGGLKGSDRRKGWKLAFVAQVGEALENERLNLPPDLYSRIGANLMAFRSERIQPGVNQEEAAPAPYQQRQPMDVPDELTLMAGRAAYNAFAHWTRVPRKRAKELLMLDRIDVLTPNGKERLRSLRNQLNGITDRVIKSVPLWADLPTGRALSRNAARTKKAFALAGQRIYIGGLSRDEIANENLDWDLAVRAFGAAACRSALYAELMGCVDLPEDCDLLCGICTMAGPVNQNDVGKAFWGDADLLVENFSERSPTSLLVWTLKAKTVSDPIGNEEQLMNKARKGALVDLRAGPHEVILIERENTLQPMRCEEGQINGERAFAVAENFVTSPGGDPIPGNPGTPWSQSLREKKLW